MILRKGPQLLREVIEGFVSQRRDHVSYVSAIAEVEGEVGCGCLC